MKYTVDEKLYLEMHIYVISNKLICRRHDLFESTVEAQHSLALESSISYYDAISITLSKRKKKQACLHTIAYL